MKKYLDLFILALILMIILAWFIPQPALYKGDISLQQLSEVGIMLIFFFYGLKLNPHKMRKDMRNIKLHLLVQSSTFILFPLLVLAARPLFNHNDQPLMWLSLFFMASLPSTVSSSVVMVSIAKGNIPGAIFNASLSGLIGIIATPLWMSLFINSGSASMELSSVLFNLFLKIIVPVCIGLVLHRYWGRLANRYSGTLALFDKGVILLIVYNSFAHSFNSQIFSSVSPLSLFIITIAVILLFILVYTLINLVSSWVKLKRVDRITALFCGSKKSLAHGTVMAGVLFKGSASLGLLLLPIMLYHAIQLIIISFIAQQMGKKHN
nr:bile acid:sodium symporter family protein [uncultured Carboxylicivirga sp.]